MNIKLDWEVYADAKYRLGCCPMCRQKRVNSVVYRASKNSATMQCKKCGLRWQVTWKSLYQALGIILESHTRNSKSYVEIYLEMHQLKRAVNVKGVHRFSPRGKKGTNERKTLLKTLLKDSKNRFSQED